MSEVKWIKITTDMFDNKKIKYLRRLPDGNNIVLIWVMLLTMAGRCNSNGMIFLTENIPYTPKILADELGFEENTINSALEALEQLDMIVTEERFFTITGWKEHQNIEGMEKIREQSRIRKQNQRAREKSAIEKSGHVTSRDSHATEEDKERDIEEDNKELVVSKDTTCPTDVARIIDAWNSLGLDRIVKITEGTQRHSWLRKRIKDYGIDALLEGIEKVRRSSFLNGSNGKGWTITFDWFIRPNNFPKVIGGNYDNDRGNSSDRNGLKLMLENIEKKYEEK